MGLCVVVVIGVGLFGVIVSRGGCFGWKEGGDLLVFAFGG